MLLSSPLKYNKPGQVNLKILHCALFIFFNRAQRVLRNDSFLVNKLDMAGTALLPIFVSGALHVAFLSPGLVSCRKGGRVPVVCALLHIILLHAVSLLLVIATLHHYPTTASFLSVLLASHICTSVGPSTPDLVPAQMISYKYIMKTMAYILPLFCWTVLPILRVHELEAIALLFFPEAVCFLFAFTLQFTSLAIHIAVTAMCTLSGIGPHRHSNKSE
jgi:hypothetical protein